MNGPWPRSEHGYTGYAGRVGTGSRLGRPLQLDPWAGKIKLSLPVSAPAVSARSNALPTSERQGKVSHMATLRVLKGFNEGTSLSLAADKDKHVLGRDPDCEVHIPVTSVSRRHTQILSMQGKFF